MFSKTNLISTIVVAVWAFFGGYLIWGLLLESFNADHLGTATGVMKEMDDVNSLYIIIGSVVTAFAISTVYSKWARGSHSLSQGAQFGIWVGIILGFGDRIVEYGVANLLDLTGTLVNGVAYVVFFMIMGIFASLVYGKVKAKA